MTTGDSNPSGENATPPTIVPPAQPQPQPQPQSQIDLAPLMTQLQALPEQMAKAVKEAVGQPKVNAGTTTPKTEEPKTETQQAQSKETAKPPATPGRKTLAQWWFS